MPQLRQHLPILTFDGPYRFLSNFSPHSVFYEGEEYPTAEHAYQAAKTLNARDRALIRAANTPGKAKRLGQTVSRRHNWEDIKIMVMHQIVLDKFSRHPGLALALVNTRDSLLVEGNSWNDNFWGIDNRDRFGGENWLGYILMLVRSQLMYSYTGL